MSPTFSLLRKGGGKSPQGCNEVPLCGTGRHGLAVRMSPTFSFCACQKENVPDTVQKKKRLGMNCPAERSNHPKRGLAVTHFRSNLKRPYRLRYTHSTQNFVSAFAGATYTGLQNRTGVFLLPRVPLRYALHSFANEHERQRKEKQGASYLHPGI